MPRRMTDDLNFERHCGHVSILLEAIKLWNGKEWVQHTLRPGVLEPSQDFLRIPDAPCRAARLRTISALRHSAHGLAIDG
jgi:hypothetical protein